MTFKEQLELMSPVKEAEGNKDQDSTYASLDTTLDNDDHEHQGKDKNGTDGEQLGDDPDLFEMAVKRYKGDAENSEKYYEKAKAKLLKDEVAMEDDFMNDSIKSTRHFRNSFYSKCRRPFYIWPMKNSKLKLTNVQK